MIKIIDVALYLEEIKSIIASNTKLFLDEKPEAFGNQMLVQAETRLYDTTSVFIGYFDEELRLQAFGRFTRWVSPSTWTMNTISTRKGTTLPKTKGGRSADCVYDIFDFAIRYFGLEGRIYFYLVETANENWVSIADDELVPALKNYFQYPRPYTLKAGTVATQYNCSTYIYSGRVLQDLNINKYEKRYDLVSPDNVGSD